MSSVVSSAKLFANFRRKEWFLLLAREVFDPNYGMFTLLLHLQQFHY